MALTRDDEELMRAYYHIFLSPQLPQQSDDESNNSSVLILGTLAALESLQFAPSTALGNVISAIASLQRINSLKGAQVDETQLSQSPTVYP